MSEYSELLAQLQHEEDTIQFTAFTNDMAIDLGLRLVQAARQAQQSVTVDICRNGQQLFHCALPGTSADNDEWIQRKCRVVNRFGHSSFYMGVYLKDQNTTIDAKYLLDPATYAPHGGAFPIIVKDVGVVGTVTVSGLPQEDDHRLVVRVLKDFLSSS
jgi:uncharacterized protein (UPF0303 family)